MIDVIIIIRHGRIDDAMAGSVSGRPRPRLQLADKVDHASREQKVLREVSKEFRDHLPPKKFFYTFVANLEQFQPNGTAPRWCVFI